MQANARSKSALRNTCKGSVNQEDKPPTTTKQDGTRDIHTHKGGDRQAGLPGLKQTTTIRSQEYMQLQDKQKGEIEYRSRNLQLCLKPQTRRKQQGVRISSLTRLTGSGAVEYTSPFPSIGSSESGSKLYINIDFYEGKNHKHLKKKKNALIYKAKQFILTTNIQEKCTYFRRRWK